MAYVRCPYCDAAPRERDFAAHVKDCRRRAEQRVPIKGNYILDSLDTRE
jgi:sarcosine oxidase delta subunit